MVALNLSDIQGVIHHPYRHPFARYLLFKFPNAESGRNFLASLTPNVTHAGPDPVPAPQCRLNLGLSFQGLSSLRVSRRVLSEFPADFRENPDAALLGDHGASAPSHWWNGKFVTKEIHLIVHLYARTRAILEQRTAEVRRTAAGCKELIPTRNGLAIETSPLGSRKGEIHFGYRDGLSQPHVRWGDAPELPGDVDFRHFLLGYSNERIPSSPSRGDAVRFARNGSYALFRLVYQDVATFNRFLEEEGPALTPSLPANRAKGTARGKAHWTLAQWFPTGTGSDCAGFVAFCKQ